MLSKATADLENYSQEVLQVLSALEEQNRSAVQEVHRQACKLLRRAEWTLSIVSGVTIFLSIWISFVIPKHYVQPLARLNEAVDPDGQAGQGSRSILDTLFPSRRTARHKLRGWVPLALRDGWVPSTLC